jgi:hypothetical protein
MSSTLLVHAPHTVRKRFYLLRQTLVAFPMARDLVNWRGNRQTWRTRSTPYKLDAHAIKIIAADTRRTVGPAGIRVVGAIFCDPLDLVGLRLSYPLMMDHSIFVMGIEARNFETTGDLSFDGALIFGELSLFRAKIAGTVFGRETLIQNTQLLDTEIRGALLLRGSVLLEPVMLDTITVIGELSLRQSIFPYFLVQFSTIGSVLDLSYSQARCAYHGF